MKSKKRTINVLRPDERSFFNTMLVVSPNWDHKLHIESVDRNELNITRSEKHLF